MLANHISISPLSGAVVSIKIEGGRDGTQWGMLESPASDEKGCQVDGVLIDRTLVDMQKETIPLRVINLSQELKVVRRGATLACCEPVVSVVAPRSLVPPGKITGISRGATPEELPDRLQPLFHRCVDGLETTKKEVVHQLLCQFPDRFSTGTNDLRCTDMVRHKIHTGNAKPVCQPPRKLSLAEVEKMSEMQKQGVIEPSMTPLTPLQVPSGSQP